ncbi:MAG: polysaccharide deacetylase family protein [Rhodobacteraceae bacterium]|nr:polysaccharide deacetylase family protein [Paracoccaceae bacterium]
MDSPVVDILMYHSISDRGGATAIRPAVFAAQMDAIAQAGLPVISLDRLLAAKRGDETLPPRSIILTFDDGFQDFADVAWPEMQRHGFRPIVYLPVAFIGKAEGWKGIAQPARPLIGWDTIRSLASEGVVFGSHTVNHANLDALGSEGLDRELDASRSEIEDRLGRPVRHFAPPYGLAGHRVRSRIARTYSSSVGTRLGRAGMTSDPFDLPRLEMFYFSDPARWRAHLSGDGGIYLARRKAMRAVKNALVKPWRGL